MKYLFICNCCEDKWRRRRDCTGRVVKKDICDEDDERLDFIFKKFNWILKITPFSLLDTAFPLLALYPLSASLINDTTNVTHHTIYYLFIKNNHFYCSKSSYFQPNDKANANTNSFIKACTS